MAGLLDFFGNGWDDPKSNAVMALAGGLLDGDFAGGMKGYSQVMAGAGEAKFKRALQQAQMDKYYFDIETGKQDLTIKQGKEKRDSEFETTMIEAIKRRQPGYGGGVVTPNMPVTGSQDGQGGMFGGGQSGGQSMGGGDMFAGVDDAAILFDKQFNGGKNIGGWIKDRTAPKWENINGNMVNTNAANFTGGFQSGMKASDNGQVTMFHPDGQGGLVVGAPKGALDTYRAYRNEDEAAKARTTTTDYTPPGGLPVRMTRAQELSLLNGVQPPQAQGNRSPAQSSEASMIANGMGGLNGLPTFPRGGTVSTKSTPQEMDTPRILQDAFATASTQFAAAQKVGDAAGMNRAQSDMEGIKQEFAKIGGGRPQSLAPNQAPQSAPSFGLPLQSLSEKERTSSENKAYETKLVEQAKADTQPTQARQANISAAENAISLVDKALLHPGLKMATGLSGVIDPRNFVPGQVGKDYKAIQSQLEGKAFLSAFEQLKGGGAISEKEGEKAQQAIARMSLSQSEKEYRQGLKDYKDVIQTGLNRMQGKDAKPEPKSLQDYGYKSNNDVIRDAQNTVMRNPSSKAEVERRLQSMGLSLGGK